MGAEVVVVPQTVICPSCSCVLHRTSAFNSHTPPPAAIGMRCLNSRCPEYRNVKLVPLQRVNVETPNEPAGLTD